MKNLKNFVRRRGAAWVEMIAEGGNIGARATRTAIAATLTAVVAAVGMADMVQGQPSQTPTEQDYVKISDHRSILLTDGLPLQPERVLQFTTREGTWMSVDVSPDGETILFDMLGDIYVLPAKGGKARRLIGGMSYDFQPRFSPDGRTIAFATDRRGEVEVYLANADGSNLRPLAKDGAFGASPAWSPDGRLVAVSRVMPGPRALNEIFDGPRLFHADGGGFAEVARGSGCCDAVFSSDGRAMYSSVRFDHPDNRLLGSMPLASDARQVVRLDRRTGAINALTSRESSAFAPVASPDGRWLVYAGRGRSANATVLMVRDLAKGTVRVLADPGPDRARDLNFRDGFMPRIAFTPNSQAVIASIGGKLWHIEVPSGQRREIPFEVDVALGVRQPVRVAGELPDGVFDVHHLRNVRLAPDGDRLAFEGLSNIYIAERKGGAIGTPRRLTKLDVVEQYPAWLPDGRGVVFSTFDDVSQGGHLYLAGVDGAAPPRRLTSRAGYYLAPVVTPDGRAVIVMRGAPQPHRDSGAAGKVELVRLDLTKSGTAETILESAIEPGELTMGSDPRRLLIFRCPQGKTWSSCTGLVQHYDVEKGQSLYVAPTGTMPLPSHKYMPPRIALSPDGKTLAVTSSQRLFYFRIPAQPFAKEHYEQARVALGADSPSWTPDGRLLTSYGTRVTLHALDRGTTEEWQIELRAKTDRPEGIIAFTNARILTMSEPQVIERGDIVIDGNWVAAIGKHGEVAIPKGATVIDATGKTILPGYIDAHPDAVAGNYKRNNPILQAYLAYGVTTLREPSGMTSQWMRDSAAAGEILGPRLIFGLRDIHESLLPAGEEMDELLCSMASAFPGSRLYKEYMGGNRLWRQRLIAAGRKCQLQITGHNAISWHQEIALAIDGYATMEHWYPGPIYEDVVQLVAKSGIIATPTWMPFSNFYPGYDLAGDAKYARFTTPSARAFYTGPKAADMLRSFGAYREEAAGAVRVLRAGGRVSMGGHGVADGISSLREIWVMADAGATPYEALQTATIHAAHAIGLAHQIGTLEVGKFADLQVLDANPLDDIRNINRHRYIMRNGRLFDASTLNEIWPLSRSAPVRWWEKRTPQ